ncbi:AgmX/PglI C-terminal domain-containing protein [Hyalangium rubrum]|uniref:AgmX/PglI C-terminal domain-containing protein n=1 Tax=Hyalangium rubrum TaxID=3103134 RepID=A0ABU5HJB5_9BACT|nr:AgmX/PglI C-terminal domain-containing protein [Hyalangium sp. s54d21]MDY7232979.1 AgmX/PglI C-terminal domain-containing protein [Hyalangium sp. s54d21]
MAAAKNNGLRLRITGPDGSTVETTADTESIIVGSGAQAAVKIQDPSVSNLHLMLKVDKDGGVTAIDLGSESGTKVDGQRLMVPKPLSHGDVLTVGESRVEVLFGADEAPKIPAGAHASGKGFQGSVTQRTPTPAPAPRAAMVPEVVTPPARTMTPPGLKARQTPTPVPVAPAPAPVASVTRTPVVAPAAVAAVMKKAQTPAHLQEPLPPSALPTAEAKVLQVAMLWGDTLLEVQHFREGVPVTIGEGKGNLFNVFVPEVGARHVLAVGKGTQVELRAPAGSGVIVTTQGDVRTKDALRASGQLTPAAADKGQVFTLGLHDRAEVSFGAVSFVVRYVRPSPAIKVSTIDEADFTFFKITCITMLAAAAVLAAMLLTPRSEAPSADDILQNQQRVAKFLIAPEKKLEIKKLKLAGVEEGAKAKDEEGKFGKEEAKKQEADPSKPGTRVVDKTKKEKDRQVVGNVGLLGAFKGLKGGASDVFGPGGLGTGINNSLGGLKAGAGLGDAQGVGGLGSRGKGTGGGGTALGIGGLGTQGNGRGTGGAGGIDLGGKGKAITKVIPGKTTVIGGLDKDVIAKVIRRHQNEIKYCYESELNKNPSLAGKVAVAFTIDPTGAVAEANVAETTLSNSTAENCMLSRIRRWKFPEPKGGGVVAVTYPWLFSPSGSEDES